MIIALTQKSQSTVQSVNIINDLEKNDHLLSNAIPVKSMQGNDLIIGTLKLDGFIDEAKNITIIIEIPKYNNQQKHNISLFELVFQEDIENSNLDKYIDGYYMKFKNFDEKKDVYLRCLSNIIEKNENNNLQIFFPTQLQFVCQEGSFNGFKLYLLYINNKYIVFYLDSINNTHEKVQMIRCFILNNNHKIST